MFKKVYIEISDICSCKCSFCPSPLMKTRRKTMSLELFEKVLYQVSPLTKRICLHILGDPLEVSNLKEYINLVSKFNLKIDLVTTGKMICDHDFDMLLKPPFHQISFSLSAFLDENNHFKDDYIANLLEFCDFSLANRSDTFINLRIQSDFLLSDNEKMIRVLDKFEKHFDIHLSEHLKHIKLNFAQKIYEKNVKIRLARKVLLNFKTSFEWRNDNLINSTKTCYALKDQLGILSDGMVVPCCIDYAGAINLGNIKSESLAQILRSQRVKNIKNGFKQGKIVENYCQKCAYLVGVS